MKDYVILTTTHLHTFIPEDIFVERINAMIADGYMPLGGCVHYGNTGLMQTMFRPPKDAS